MTTKETVAFELQVIREIIKSSMGFEVGSSKDILETQGHILEHVINRIEILIDTVRGEAWA